jgi:uncharacterized protein (DUF849 family)
LDVPLIIEASLNGVRTRGENPHVPLAPAEIRADARRCAASGASIIHAHSDDITLTGEAAAAAYLEAWRPLLNERPSMLWYPTFALASEYAARIGHIELISREAPLPLMAVDPGSTNIGVPGADGLPTGSPYVNSYEDISSAFELCERLRLGPMVAIFEPGFLRTALAHHLRGTLPSGALIKLYFGDGVSFGLPPTRPALLAYLEMLEGTGLPWAVSVWGGDVLATPIAQLAVERGGHLVVGLEPFADPNRTPTNVELVTEAAALAAKVGRPVAGEAESRALLGLPVAPGVSSAAR